MPKKCRDRPAQREAVHGSRPLRRAAELADVGAGRHGVAEGPARGEGVGVVLAHGHRRRLVEPSARHRRPRPAATSALPRIAVADELEVARRDGARQLQRPSAMRAAEHGVGVVQQGDVGLEQRDQARARHTAPGRPSSPRARRSQAAPTASSPRKSTWSMPTHAAMRAAPTCVTGVAVAPVGPLAGREGRLDVALPPRGSGSAPPTPPGVVARGDGSLEAPPARRPSRRAAAPRRRHGSGRPRRPSAPPGRSLVGAGGASSGGWVRRRAAMPRAQRRLHHAWSSTGWKAWSSLQRTVRRPRSAPSS